MTPPAIVVFDLDDTLFPERDYVASGFDAVDAEVRTRFGRSGFAAIAARLLAAGVRGRIIDEALARLGLPADAATVASLVDVYRGHRPAIALYPDVAPVLRVLASRARLALISDGPLCSQQRKVAMLGLDRWLDPIFLTDRWGRAFWKPHERAFVEVERRVGAGGAQCAYVGDNPAKDFAAPRRRGWRTIRVRRPGGMHAAAVAPGAADAECAGVAEAIRWLGFEDRQEEVWR